MTHMWASNEEAEAKGELRGDILINSELQESLYLNISLVKRDWVRGHVAGEIEFGNLWG